MSPRRKKGAKVGKPDQKINSSQKSSQKSIDNDSCSEAESSECEPCAECHSEIYNEDPAVQCDMCENWYCNKKCLKFSQQEYDRLGKSKANDGVMWFCKHCRISFPATKKILGNFAKLEKRQNDIEEKVKAMDSKITQSINNPSPMQSSSETNISDIVSEVLSEQHEREERKLNVVCFGLNESTKDQPEARREEDKCKIVKVLTEVMNLQDVLISDPVRLGRYAENSVRCRPVRFTVDSIAIKQKIIERSRVNVKNSKLDICRNLFFQSDLTPKQREEAYKIRVERRKQNAERSHDQRNTQRFQGTRTVERSERSQTSGACGSTGDFFRR